MLGRKAENRPSNASPAHRGHAVNHVGADIGMPRAIDLGVGLVWPWSERKDGERPSLIGYEKAVSVRNVFLSVNAARTPVGPLCGVPVLPHERPGMLIRPLNKLVVGRGGESNLHVSMIGGATGHSVSF